MSADTCRSHRGLCGPYAAICALTLAAAALLQAGAHGQAPSARDLFEAARARENAIRTTLAHPERGAPDPARSAYLQAVSAYRLVVLRYPTSGYCDDALWSGAHLAAESFARFGADADRRTAIDLYARLAKEYPSSRLVADARAEISRLSPAASSAPPATGEPAAVASPSAPAAPRPTPPSGEPAAPAASASTPVLVKDIRRRTTPDGVDVDIEMDGPVTVKTGRLDRPPRLFLDLTPAQATGGLRDAILTYESGAVRQVRVGRPAPQTTRVVVETVTDVTCHAGAQNDAHRLTVTCRETPAAVQPVVVTSPPPAPPAAAAPADSRPVPPSANARGGFSIARQLGLRVGRIVIDPGHGGRDPGAMGHGTSEAAIVLDIALRLEKLLAKEPGVDVVLTRRADEFIPLQERPAIANREQADLFVSIHVNAHRDRSVRGVETYLLNFASTPDAAAVAARENASSSLTMSHLNDLVKQIALGSKLQESNDLARHLQDAMVKKLKASNRSLRNLGVKQAPFVVLVGASMPSVLVEVAFLTNSSEGKLLATGAYWQRVAESLVDGVRRYLRTLKRAEAVADQAPARSATPVR